MKDKIKNILKKLAKTAPLIHCITNPISINQCANLILSCGCSPIMAEHPGEVEEITFSADALLLNLGNITDVRMKSMLISADTAQKKHIPVVFDAVGTACSSLRRKFTYEFLKKYSPDVIKGNYSEINALYNCEYKSAGVDAESHLKMSYIKSIAVKLAKKYDCIILASGKTDIITDGKTLIYIKNGTPQLSKVTGTGCMLGALVACYMTVFRDMYAVAAACATLGICGEKSETDKGSGTFMLNLLDRLSTVTEDNIKKYIRMEEEAVEKI